jgi:general secretion pathway protein I
MKPRALRQQQHGYTLLEMVVAFTILVLSLSALFESFSATLLRSEKARNLSRAGLLAESVRARAGVDLSLAAPVSNGKDGDCDWEVQARALPRENTDHPLAVNAYRVAIDTRCGAAGAMGRAHLDTVSMALPQ